MFDAGKLLINPLVPSYAASSITGRQVRIPVVRPIPNPDVWGAKRQSPMKWE
jgi:hypothetical protein